MSKQLVRLTTHEKIASQRTQTQSERESESPAGRQRTPLLTMKKSTARHRIKTERVEKNNDRAPAMAHG
jgi:hypothetical protein